MVMVLYGNIQYEVIQYDTMYSVHNVLILHTDTSKKHAILFHKIDTFIPLGTDR